MRVSKWRQIFGCQLSIYGLILYHRRRATAPSGLGGWTTGLTILASKSTTTLNVLSWDTWLWLLATNVGKWDSFHEQPGGLYAGVSTQVTLVSSGTTVLLVWAANSLWHIRGVLNILNMNKSSVPSAYTHIFTWGRGQQPHSPVVRRQQVESVEQLDCSSHLLVLSSEFGVSELWAAILLYQGITTSPLMQDKRLTSHL